MDFLSLPTTRPPILASKYVVASGHYLATLAGVRILEQGGTVFDAGVAAGLCLNVVQPDMTSMGGVAPIILREARSGLVMTVSGLGWWPRATSASRFGDGAGLTTGILTSVVPGALDAWVQTLDRYGTMSFAEVAAPALELAEGGFPVNRFLHDNLRQFAERLARWPSSRDVLLASGQPPEMGQRLVQKELAKTFRMLGEAERGAASRQKGLQAVRDLFYTGDIGRQMVRFCEQMDGFLGEDDLAAFRVKFEPPVTTSYRGHTIYGCGPWCQGPVVLQTLNILEGYDLSSMRADPAPALHLIVEALLAAFADRHAYYGDPDIVDVPIAGLLSKTYAASWRDRIDRARAWPAMPNPGDPWAHQGHPRSAPTSPGRPVAGPASPDTSYVCVLDADGNAFSATPSDGVLETPLVPGLGFIISSRGSQSWLDEGHPSVWPRGRDLVSRRTRDWW